MVARTLVATTLLLAVLTGCGTDAPEAGPTHVQVARGPVGLARDGSGHVWVAAADADAVQRLGGRAVKVGRAPLRLAYAGGLVWATVFRDGTLVGVDPATGKVAKTVTIGDEPEGVTAASGSLWVVQQRPATLVEVDPDTAEVVRRTPVGAGPRLVVGALGALWMSDYTAGKVIRIDPSGGHPRTSPALCDGPQGMAAVAGRLWVACTNDETVLALDPGTLRRTATLKVSGHPDALAEDGNGHLLVALQDGPALATVDPAEPAVSRRQRLGRALPLHDRANVDLVVGGGKAYVTSYLDARVYVVRLP